MFVRSIHQFLHPRLFSILVASEFVWNSISVPNGTNNFSTQPRGTETYLYCDISASEAQTFYSSSGERSLLDLLFLLF